MRNVWVVGVWLLVAHSVAADPWTLRPSTELQEGDVVTTNKPTAREVAAMLQLDPKHDRVRIVVPPARIDGRVDRGFIRWERVHDGMLVLNEAARSFKEGNTWRTRFYRAEVEPPPVRRVDLLSPKAAIASTANGMPAIRNPVAELVYRTTLGARRKPWTLEGVTTIAAFQLVYYVHEKEWLGPPAFLVDPYSGSIVVKDSGIRE